jgi:hypothetical protein
MRVTKTNPVPPGTLTNEYDIHVGIGLNVSFRDHDDKLRVLYLSAKQAHRLGYLLQQGAYKLEGKVIEQDDEKYVIEVPNE